MMYSRLKIARNLLTQDGVCFISIGDDEVHNLRTMCNEIFGENNAVVLAPRVAKRTSNKGTHFRPTKDYVLAFARDITKLPAFGIPKIVDKKDYKFTEENGRKFKQSGASLFQPSLDPMRGCINQRYYIEAPDGSLIIPPGNVFPEAKTECSKIAPQTGADKVWRWSVDSYSRKKHRLIFTKGSSKNPLLDEDGNQSKWNIYPKVYLDEDLEKRLYQRTSSMIIQTHKEQKS